jgi:hypothetical protein
VAWMVHPLGYIGCMLSWDALTAIGTASMALATFFVVLQGWHNWKDDERRHQDGFKPICILTPYDGVDPRHRRDSLRDL